MFFTKPSKWEQTQARGASVELLESTCQAFSEWLRMHKGRELEADYLLLHINSLLKLAELFKELELVLYETDYITVSYNSELNTVAIDLK